MNKLYVVLLLLSAAGFTANAQVNYPYPVKKITLSIENRKVNMAYMDIAPGADSAAKTVLLLHGKNFNGYYWKNLIPLLRSKGYRIVIPDQVGWGESDHPNIYYSFHQLAKNTRQLLSELGIDKTIVIGHSMGGMLATRFALMYPETVTKLILENPIGLEDYKTFVPYQPMDSLLKKELSATYESYKKYQQSYYPSWKPAYDQYVDAQAADLKKNNFDSIAWANAVTYQMIYTQPVCYEFSHLKMPVLLVIGQADRTVVGKDKLTEAQKKVYGNYPQLGRRTQRMIKGASLIEMPGVGHIPHVQDITGFWNHIKNWLDK